jgi:hypothetical protein
VKRVYFILTSLVFSAFLYGGCGNPQGNVSTIDSGFHPGIPSASAWPTSLVLSECPSSGGGTLHIPLGSLNISGAPASNCTVTNTSTAMQGTPTCGCVAGVCSVTGLTFTTAFLNTMSPGINAYIPSALTYSVTSANGTNAAVTAISVTASTWQPTCLGSSLSMWLDASQSNSLFNDSAGTIPITNGAGVGLWTDLSGNGYNASATAKPTYNSATNALSFNGSSSFMTSLMTAGVLFGTSGTIFAMLSPSGANATDAGIINFRFVAGNNTGLIYMNTTTYGFDWGTSGAYGWNSGLVPVVGQFGVVGLVNTPTGALMSFNGNTNSTIAYAGTLSNNNSAIPMIIGNDTGSAGRFYYGQMGEIILSTTFVSTVVRQQIEGYLAWKWNTQSRLVAGHPYLSFAP